MKFSIEFESAADVNLALGALAQLPYHQVERLIGSIERQAREQERLAKQPPAQDTVG